MGLGVQPPAIKVHVPGIVRTIEPGASQQCLDPGLQLPGAEGLGQVVVGTDFKADHTVGFVRARGQHDDRHL